LQLARPSGAGDLISMTTFIPKAGEAERRWFLIDAKDLVLGRVATAAATVLTGKRKPTYTPFLDTGDHVVVINAEKVHLTGRKESDKIYHTHSGYLGGLKSTAASDLRKRKPTKIVEEAIRGMLPKTKLGRAMFTKLKVYVGEKHPHSAQKPQPLAVK
jgi:large subunit ribosomal protein L13